MADRRLIVWLERLIWLLIYGGLFGAVIGLHTRGQAPTLGTTVALASGVAVVCGIALIWLRSRLRA